MRDAPPGLDSSSSSNLNDSRDEDDNSHNQRANRRGPDEEQCKSNS
jgi:hypothetical protein